VHDAPFVWDETRDINVPWGEIDIGTTIFTLPSPEMRKVLDFKQLKTAYDSFTGRIRAFLAYDAEQPYRIVFDSEIPKAVSEKEEEVRVDYPVTFLMEEIHAIVLDISQPRPALFRAIRSLALLSIPVNCLDSTTETTLATVATVLAFQTYFGNFDPFTAGLDLPALFEKFWVIETCSPGVLSKTLQVFQNLEYVPMETPDDMWVEFVRELCRCGNCNYTRVLEQVRPVPLNLSRSLQELPLLSADEMARYGRQTEIVM
jgi:hypothetical protein